MKPATISHPFIPIGPLSWPCLMEKSWRKMFWKLVMWTLDVEGTFSKTPASCMLHGCINVCVSVFVCIMYFRCPSPPFLLLLTTVSPPAISLLKHYLSIPSFLLSFFPRWHLLSLVHLFNQNFHFELYQHHFSPHFSVFLT